MSVADDVPKMNILSLASSAVLTTAVEVRMGGAGVSMKVPEWATMLRGIWVNNQCTTQTNDETMLAFGRLDTNDGLPIKPFEFIYPPIGAWGTTPGAGNGTKSEFYPVNAPVMPGSNIQCYGTLDETITANGYIWADFVFSNDLIKNPKDIDRMPDTQRYRVIGTVTATVAAGRAVGTAYNFNGGKMVTEASFITSVDAQSPNTAGVGFISLESNDVPIWPMNAHVDPYGSVLGNTGHHLAPECVTRRPIMAPCEPVVQVQDYFTSGAGLTHTTGHFLTGVEFIR